MKLAERRLLGRLQRLLERQHALDVLEIIAGIEDVTAVLVLDEDGVAGKADFAGGPAVPENVKAVDYQRAAVEQIDLRVRHDFLLSGIFALFRRA